MCKHTIRLILDDNNQASNIAVAAEALKKGKLVAFPTETVYGLGANALDDKAVKSIFIAKGRPQDNPFIVHVAAVKQILPLVGEFSATAQKLANAFWPGALTIIMPKSEKVSDVVTANRNSIAIRVPSHPVARELLLKAEIPVAAPSANRSGTPSSTTASHCYNDLNGRVDIILDGGNCDIGVESTVISLVGNSPTLLRPGGITVKQLEDTIGKVEVNPAILKELEETEEALSPGMKHKHYAPKAKVVLIKGSSKQFVDYCNNSEEPGLYAMAFEEEVNYLNIPVTNYGKEALLNQQAFMLFSVLRDLDNDDRVKVIYIHAPSVEGIGLAIYNRLLRAADFNEIRL